ncbi:hypothetical protein WR25_23597 isoform C [Diploscapter pachys]|uniref:Uncharacterized protein n=1 Tax=Diploscapter pachys TaxID=2018661 RepID=A0A2A2L2R2_9BILA|nr:hypothetical protein WR25_23597 isoform C [Diploscapter pachys]
MAPSSSPGQHDSIVPFVRQQHKRNLAADPLRIQLLEKRLDLLPFVQQLERKLTQPIKIPATPMPLLPGKSGKLSIFSIRTIFPYDNDDLRRETRSKLFNLKSLNLPNREWIKDLLLEESDSDDEGSQFFFLIFKNIIFRRCLLTTRHSCDSEGAQNAQKGAETLSHRPHEHPIHLLVLGRAQH